MKKVIKVVGAIIFKGEQILCAQRSSTMSLPLMWEFPGGKIEPDETPQDALIRELKEEMNCAIEVKDFVTTTVYEYDFAIVELSTYIAEITEGTIQLNEHSNVLYLKPNELKALDWAPADIPAVNLLIEKYSK